MDKESFVPDPTKEQANLTNQKLFVGYVCACQVTSVMSDSLQPHGLQPTRLLCPWDSPGKNTGVGCHALLQGLFLIQRSNLCLLCLLGDIRVLYHYHHQKSPNYRLLKNSMEQILCKSKYEEIMLNLCIKREKLLLKAGWRRFQK